MSFKKHTSVDNNIKWQHSMIYKYIINEFLQLKL